MTHPLKTLREEDKRSPFLLMLADIQARRLLTEKSKVSALTKEMIHEFGNQPPVVHGAKTFMPGEAERLTPPRRKQLLKDGLLAVGGMTVGHVVGKMLADKVFEQAQKDPTFAQKVVRHGPTALMALGLLGTYAHKRQKNLLRQRRDAAEAEHNRTHKKKYDGRPRIQ